MNKITPDKNVKIEIFDDFSLFSLDNIIIGQYAAKIIQGSNNIIIGNNAAKIAIDVNNSIYLGIDSGKNILSGNSNISIGDDIIYNNNINNYINIGLNNNIYNNNSITIGNNLNNSNLINIGYDKSQININNSNININDLFIGDVIRFGISNSTFNNGINIGNNNSNININIGSSNNSLNSNSIIIGNNINNTNFSLNINNLICKYENNNSNFIYLGIGLNQNIPIIIGSTLDNIDDNNDNNQIKIKGLLNLNKLVLKNNNNISIILKNNNNNYKNIIYYLPPFPSDIKNYFLSINKNGFLEWKEITKDIITTIITSGDIICNNINSLFIKGKGYFLKNININNNTTDNINEGLKNIFFNNFLINNLFYSTINNISTDFIKDSFNSNLYYNETLYEINFKKNIENINSDFISQNTIKFYKLNDFFDASLNHLLTISTDDINLGVSNIYFTDNIVDKFSSNFINIVKEGKSNLYYTDNRFKNVFNNYIINTNTNEFKQGSTNLYLDNQIINSNINLIISNINSDGIIEGKNNLYYTDNRLINFFNSNIISTNNIKEGSSNLYFDKITNFNITTDIIKEGSNKYYTDDNNIKSRIINNIDTNIFTQGNSNKYLIENNILNQYSNYLLNDISTDNISINNNYSFITNNFYNNDLIINGFIQSSNVNNIDISIDRLNLEMAEPSIGPLTEVINIYDYNTLFLNNKLSNIDINISYDNIDINSNIPFIVVENRVGINNINPKFNLHVGTGNDTVFFSKIHLANTDIDTGNYGIMIISSNNNINGHDLKIQNRITSNGIFKDSLIINSSGNIGIGNNNPQSLLHLNISTPSSDIILRMTDNTTGHGINNGLILRKDNLQNGIFWNYQNANLIFGTNNIERFKIDNNGNCYINVPSSYNYELYGYNQKLTIGGFGSGNNNWGQFYIYDNRNINDINYLGLIFKADTFNNNCSIQTEKLNVNTNIPLLLNPKANNVGIGLYNPSQKLHVSGNIVATGSITSSFSDIRLKTKTSNLNNSLDIITKLNGFKYKSNDIAKKFGFNDDNEMVGLNAQEVNKYIPEVISLAPFDMDRNENNEIISKSGNNYLSIQYERLIPYLIEAIKELKKENDIIKLSLNKK